MARCCGLGMTHFIHHSKQLTNMTPAQHLNHCRLGAAQQLLREKPELSISRVAVACGFSSSQYFATLFNRKYGVPPRQFRRDGGHETLSSG